MRKLPLYLFALLTVGLYAQTPTGDEDFFRYYGMPNSPTYTTFKDAFADARKGTVYKLNTSESQPKKLDKLAEVTSLQLLKLSNNGIAFLPNEIGRLSSLIYFKSENNPLKTLPHSIGGWAGLVYLKLINTKIDSLPKEIGYLDKLKEFEWIGNTGGDTLELPAEIRYWKNLKRLVIDSVVLDTLPKELALLTELNELSLTACNLDTLPALYGEYKGKEVGLTKLQILTLSNNNLHTIPSTLFYCRNIRRLDLSNNKLTVIPDDISYLNKLELLDLRGNNFSAYQLAVLQSLLPGCKIFY